MIERDDGRVNGTSEWDKWMRAMNEGSEWEKDQSDWGQSTYFSLFLSLSFSLLFYFTLLSLFQYLSFYFLYFPFSFLFDWISLILSLFLDVIRRTLSFYGSEKYLCLFLCRNITKKTRQKGRKKKVGAVVFIIVWLSLQTDELTDRYGRFNTGKVEKSNEESGKDRKGDFFKGWRLLQGNGVGGSLFTRKLLCKNKHTR